MPENHVYTFLRELARSINSGASNSLLLTGNINDLFFNEDDDSYAPLVEFLKKKWSNTPGKMILVSQINGMIRFPSPEARREVKKAWIWWKLSLNPEAGPPALEQEFENNLSDLSQYPTATLELLRQFCLCSRTRDLKTGRPFLEKDLIVIIESAEILIPESGIADLSHGDRHRIRIALDWFSDQGFIDGPDSVVLIAESASLLNSKICRLPFVKQIVVPLPDKDARKHYVTWFNAASKGALKLWSTEDDFAALSAGLNLYELRQMMKESMGYDQALNAADVIARVEGFIKNQLGEDVVEFKKPEHDLDNDVIGSARLKGFLKNSFIPRIRAGGPGAIAGAAVAGPIGSGKTFIFEAAAARLGIPVLTLKNIRSQWFGQTDVIFERLKRVLEALHQVMIFIDEADTQFGSVGAEAHDTEKRLTGKIQNMMADSRNRGKIVWLLLTARIHLLSPDLRRPGRAGDLIIPVLDPDPDERKQFVAWVLATAGLPDAGIEAVQSLDTATAGYYPSTYALLRSEIKAALACGGKDRLTLEEVQAIAGDIIPGAITEVRRYQTLQALVNCTRKSLIPVEVTDSVIKEWQDEIAELESRGIR
ncbi:MAG: ATP-binding protein [Candidatus Wallbacteria bacterium]|nr:ATP-binding protein [Candidatus Wallbacteria bacterium]